VRYLTLREVLELHQRIMAASGGRESLAALSYLEAAVALPRQTFGGADLYPDLTAKAAILGFALIQGHPFLDGNKRAGHAAMEAFLMLNGHELTASVNDAEGAVLMVANSSWTQADFLASCALVASRIRSTGLPFRSPQLRRRRSRLPSLRLQCRTLVGPICAMRPQNRHCEPQAGRAVRCGWRAPQWFRPTRRCLLSVLHCEASPFFGNTEDYEWLDYSFITIIGFTLVARRAGR
jgi:death-on-curing protein